MYKKGKNFHQLIETSNGKQGKQANKETSKQQQAREQAKKETSKHSKWKVFRAQTMSYGIVDLE